MARSAMQHRDGVQVEAGRGRRRAGAVNERAIVATILCGHDGRRGLIHHLAVTPSHRRQGLGRALVSRALSALRAVHIQKCHLLVFRENAAGLTFWRRLGADERVTLTTFSLPT